VRFPIFDRFAIGRVTRAVSRIPAAKTALQLPERAWPAEGPATDSASLRVENCSVVLVVALWNRNPAAPKIATITTAPTTIATTGVTHFRERGTGAGSADALAGGGGGEEATGVGVSGPMGMKGRAR